jgi:hypothetical protein
LPAIPFDELGGGLVVLSFEVGPQLAPCDVERFGEYACLSRNGHEVGVAAPARKRMEMDVVGDASAGGFAKIESHVKPVRFVGLAQPRFGALSELDQFLRGGGRQRSKRIEMLIRHNHQMASGVRIGVETDEAVQAPVDDVSGSFGCLPAHPMGDGVVDGGNHIAEDAMLIFGLGSSGRPRIESGRNTAAGLRVRPGDVVIAPRSPEPVHIPSIAAVSLTARLQRPADA